jgi:hypothetical protein
VRGGAHKLELTLAGSGRVAQLAAEPVQALHRHLDRPDTFRSIRVVRRQDAGIVLERGDVVDVEHVDPLAARTAVNANVTHLPLESRLAPGEHAGHVQRPEHPDRTLRDRVGDNYVTDAVCKHLASRFAQWHR